MRSGAGSRSYERCRVQVACQAQVAGSPAQARRSKAAAHAQFARSGCAARAQLRCSQPAKRAQIARSSCAERKQSARSQAARRAQFRCSSCAERRRVAGKSRTVRRQVAGKTCTVRRQQVGRTCTGGGQVASRTFTDSPGIPTLFRSARLERGSRQIRADQAADAGASRGAGSPQREVGASPTRAALSWYRRCGPASPQSLGPGAPAAAQDGLRAPNPIDRSLG